MSLLDMTFVREAQRNKRDESKLHKTPKLSKILILRESASQDDTRMQTFTSNPGSCCSIFQALNSFKGSISRLRDLSSVHCRSLKQRGGKRM